MYFSLSIDFELEGCISIGMCIFKVVLFNYRYGGSGGYNNGNSYSSSQVSYNDN